MPKGSQKSPTPVTVVPKLVELLTPLTGEDRQRTIDAAMILLGEPVRPAFKASTQGGVPAPLQQSQDGVAIKASAWMKKNNITLEQIEHVVAIDSDSVEVIASRMPGGSKRQQTIESYVIAGLQAFLKTGEPNFTDKDARAVCSKVGCYDSPNHSNYVKGLGNLVSGSKDTTWKLSNPGLSKAAEIVRELTATANA